jgi:hypothetical protein
MISCSNSSYTRTLSTRDDEVEFLVILKKHAYPSLTCRRADTSRWMKPYLIKQGGFSL